MTFATSPSLACLITTSTRALTGQRLVPVRDLAQDRLAELPEAADHDVHRTARLPDVSGYMSNSLRAAMSSTAKKSSRSRGSPPTPMRRARSATPSSASRTSA